MKQWSFLKVVFFIGYFATYCGVAFAINAFSLNTENAFLFDKIHWSLSNNQDFLEPLIFTQPFLPFMTYFLPQVLFGKAGYVLLNALLVSSIVSSILKGFRHLEKQRKIILGFFIVNPFIVLISFQGGITLLSFFLFFALIYFVCKFLFQNNRTDLSKAGLIGGGMIFCTAYSSTILIILFPVICLSALINCAKGNSLTERLKKLIQSEAVRNKLRKELWTSSVTFYSLPILIFILELALSSYNEGKARFQLNYFDLVGWSWQVHWYIKLGLIAALNLYPLLLARALPDKREIRFTYWAINLLLMGFAYCWPYQSLAIMLFPSCFSFVFLYHIKSYLHHSTGLAKFFFADFLIKLAVFVGMGYGHMFFNDNFSHGSYQIENREIESLEKFFHSFVPEGTTLALNPDFLFQLSPKLSEDYRLNRMHELNLEANYYVFHVNDPVFRGLTTNNDNHNPLPTKEITLASKAVLKLVFLTKSIRAYELIIDNNL